MAPLASTDLTSQLAQDGFCLVPDVLTGEQLDSLRVMARQKLADAQSEHLQRYAHHGSLLPLHSTDRAVHDLLISSELGAAFQGLGFTDPRWISGYVIAKPPKSPGLWWHQDWWGWGHPNSYLPEPTQIFCMLYLEPTTVANGCLRAMPGTHLQRHPLHDALPVPHTPDIESRGPQDVANIYHDGEIDIKAQPGDLVIGDVRLIHATHANDSDTYRTAIDLLFLPHYDSLPDELKQHYVGQFCLPPEGWWREPDNPLIGAPIARLLPTYDGAQVPPSTFNRQPVWPSD